MVSWAVFLSSVAGMTIVSCLLKDGIYGIDDRRNCSIFLK